MTNLNFSYLTPSHSYVLYSQGLKKVIKAAFRTRKEAEIEMQNICSRNNITGLECTECDKHERKYSNHKGVRFYINRV